MGANKRILEDRMTKPRKNGAGRQNSIKFVAFHPTVEEKKFIREGGVLWEHIIDRLTTALDNGLAVSIKAQPYQDCFCLVVREDKPFGEDAIAISFWHMDVLACFEQMVVAFDGRYKNFPKEVQLSLPGSDTDW